MISHSINKDNIGYNNMYYNVIVSKDILLNIEVGYREFQFHPR